MLALATTLNGELGDDCVEPQVLHDAFDKFWPELESRVRAISQTALSPQSVPLVVRAFAKFGLSEPQVGSAVYFSAGFESHAVYDTVCAIATQRLFVFGRKNRKLFDKEHFDFIASLPGRISSHFDFRCLFLDPKAPAHILASAHQDADFPNQLRTSIRNAVSVLEKAGLDADRHCRTYAIQRPVSSIIADDAVLYTLIQLEPDGKASKLTKCAFTVVNAHSPTGEELTKEFTNLWETGKPITVALEGT